MPINRKVIHGGHNSVLPLPPSRIRRIQKTALILLLISGVINYVDRASLAVGLPLIRQDLGISWRPPFLYPIPPPHGMHVDLDTYLDI